MEVQGLRSTNQFQAAARRAAVEERNRCAVIHVGSVDECHRQAPRRFDPVDPELDPSSCGKARGAPSTRAGRERGRNGTGRTLAFPSKKKNKLWIWLAFDRSGQRLIDWECGNRDAAPLNRLLERLKPWSCTVQTIMRLTTRSCRLGGTISARMKRWQLSRSTVACVIGLPAFGLCGVESARARRRHHPTVCGLPRQSNRDKTGLATGCMMAAPLEYLLHVGYPGKKRLGGNRLGRVADDVGAN